MQGEKFIEKAINWVQSKGMHTIRSEHDDFEDPTSFTRHGKSGDITFTPAITAFHRTRKRYIEVANKNVEDVKKLASKWKLLSTLASRSGGEFYILAPHGHKAFAQRLIDKYNLNSKVVTI